MKFDWNKIINDYKVSSVTADSRKVKEGSIFVSIQGNKLDGNVFINQAIEAGANIIVSEKQIDIDGIASFKVANSRISLGELLQSFYTNIPNNLYAVTGTNGKSSVVHYINEFLKKLNIPSASIGTLGTNTFPTMIGNSLPVSNLTTYDIETLYNTLEALKINGIDSVALEASSIGLDQLRLYGLKFKTCGFTSFSQDHLDYHKDMLSYLKAKLRLFSEYLAKDGKAIICKDTPFIEEILTYLKDHNINFMTIGSEESDDCYIESISQDIFKQECVIHFNYSRYFFYTNTLGAFQIKNILVALFMLVNNGYDINQLINIIPDLPAPKGRLERIAKEGIGSRIFVDYAHTPDALQNILIEQKKLTTITGGKIYLIFGCGGDRDKSKRPLMGDIAYKYSDYVIITDDNPRTENPELIRKEILATCKNAIEIGDRKEAIIHAINKLKNNDILLIAGKGHEEYQIYQDKKIYFSDIKICQEIIQNSLKNLNF